jgi:hypothetical protein
MQTARQIVLPWKREVNNRIKKGDKQELIQRLAELIKQASSRQKNKENQ